MTIIIIISYAVYPSCLYWGLHLPGWLIRYKNVDWTSPTNAIQEKPPLPQSYYDNMANAQALSHLQITFIDSVMRGPVGEYPDSPGRLMGHLAIHHPCVVQKCSSVHTNLCLLGTYYPFQKCNKYLQGTRNTITYRYIVLCMVQNCLKTNSCLQSNNNSAWHIKHQ